MRRLTRALAVVGAVAIVLVIAGGIAGGVMLRDGFSARDRPLPGEARLARLLRTWSVPAAARKRTNPVKMTAAAMMDARAHFADHCAQCHGNDGGGRTEMGRGTYPQAPDLRTRDTQDMSDGEIYYWIENGVRLTAMPAWGEGGYDDTATWKLVAFIRQLPKLTAEGVAAMEFLNPRSPEEWRELQEESSFLNGGEAPKAAPRDHPHGGH